MKAAGVYMDDVVVAGIDATPDGLAAMEAGDLDVTVFQNATRQGEVALERRRPPWPAGQAVEPQLWIPFEPVTRENLTDYLQVAACGRGGRPAPAGTRARRVRHGTSMRPTMKIALDPFMHRHLSLEALPSKVAELGYEWVEL